jgi:uncharacterized protein involved in exopolysaccharide biosynthesis
MRSQVAEMTSVADGFIGTRTLRDVRAAVARRSRVVIICFLALSAGAVAAVLMAPPVYEGQMKILVKRDREDSVVSGAADPAASRSDLSEAELMSQVELIKANDLLEKVAAEAGLATRMRALERARDDVEALVLATKALRRDLAIAPIRKTWLIDVRYSSEDPKLTRNVLDTLVRLYLEKHLALHRPAGTYRFFSEQTERARQELTAAQERLAQFSQRNHVASAAVEREAVLQKLAEFDAMRAQAAATHAETTRRLAAITSELSRVPLERTSQVRIIDDAAVMQDVKSRILTLEMKRAELLQKFTPEYRGVIEIERQLREARAALAEARNAPVREETISDNPTRQWLDTELARTRTENAAVSARMRALAVAVSEYRAEAQMLDLQDVEQKNLMRSLKAAEDKYLLYAQKQEEARISDELDRTRIANVVIAQAPAMSFERKRSLSLAMLPLLFGAALMISFAVAFVVDARALRSIDELRRRNDLLEARLNGKGTPERHMGGVIPIADANGLIQGA